MLTDRPPGSSVAENLVVTEVVANDRGFWCSGAEGVEIGELKAGMPFLERERRRQMRRRRRRQEGNRGAEGAGRYRNLQRARRTDRHRQPAVGFQIG